jgi:hypothetical protein
MTTEVNTENGTKEVPTATEFIPTELVPDPNRTGNAMVRTLQRVRNGKGVEIAAHEPYDDEVENHVYVCDECGHSEDTEDGIELHLRTEHEN